MDFLIWFLALALVAVVVTTIVVSQQRPECPGNGASHDWVQQAGRSGTGWALLKCRDCEAIEIT